MLSFRIVPAGDAALVVEVAARIDPELNAWCVALSRALQQTLGSAVRDVVVGYCTVTAYYDPLAIDATWLEEQIGNVAATLEVEGTNEGAVIDVPVCYGGEMGPDLAEVATFAGCSEDTVVDLHLSRDYRVYVLGFVPGFAYMAEVNPRIAMPRRSSPRTQVPKGSVAIAAGQTGIYPAETPGGWNIIGRTPIEPYDPARDEPFLFRPGDRVRFQRIDRQAFDELQRCKA
jgi:inhibitor of KinA